MTTIFQRNYHEHDKRKIERQNVPSLFINKDLKTKQRFVDIGRQRVRRLLSRFGIIITVFNEIDSNGNHVSGLTVDTDEILDVELKSINLIKMNFVLSSSQVTPAVLMVQGLGNPFMATANNAYEYHNEMLKHWGHVQRNRMVCPHVNADYSQIWRAITYSRPFSGFDGNNFKITLDRHETRFGDHEGVLNNLKRNYPEINFSDSVTVQALVVWIECTVRQMCDESRGNEDVDVYIANLKNKFFPNHLVDFHLMSLAAILESHFNAQLLVERQQTAGIDAFNLLYLNRYISKLDDLIKIRRSSRLSTNKIRETDR